ncbi:phage tail protein [Acinetobacter baumannii]
MLKFEWSPDLGCERDETPLVTVTKFGDGYEARLATGINSQPNKWTVTFTNNLDEYRKIRAFLKQHGAVKAFEWVDPEGELGRYVCRSWKSKQVGFGVLQITGVFEQVFE